jgi:copper(I)-binding protein
MRIVAPILMALLAGATAASACDVRIESAWILAPPPKAATLAGYATLVNTSRKPQRVVGAESLLADSVTLHETMMHGDMAMMHDVPELLIPAGGKVELAPGGKHLMLMKLKKTPKAGDHVTITLIDASGCRIAGDFVVRART